MLFCFKIMFPDNLIQFEHYDKDSVVAFVVAGEHKGVPVHISMSGDSEDNARESLKEYAKELWQHLRTRPDSKLGNIPRTQKEFLQKHMTSEKMKVTGYQLREALDEAKLVLSTTADQFESSLHAFEDEDKKSPEVVMESIRAAEDRVAELQALQEQYNQQVTVTADGQTMTLALAIKRRGYADRISALWKSAMTGGEVDRRYRYMRDDPKKRSKDDEYAKPTITPDQATTLARQATRRTNALKTAIAKANLTEVEMNIDFEL